MALRSIEVDGKKFDISYEIIGQGERDIIFLHGWGSNKEIMKVFVPYFKEYRQVYIDMPGFGKSTNDYILTTQDYANVIDTFLNELNIKKDVILGHSFGGKVATLLKPELLVLLASAGIVMPKPLSVRVKIKTYKLLKKLGFSKFRKFFVSSDANGMSENMYETFKNVVNEDFSSVFEKYRGKVLIFGGSQDTAVPPEAVKKQGELLKSKIIMLSGGHYFFFNDKDAKKNREEIVKRIKSC
ncbi:alpha/beta fold hydrolase [Caminibacter sp.]